MAKEDYYEILGVKPTDSSETIKKSYKKLALKFHPDKVGDNQKKEYEENFKKINEAYSTLGNEEKRKRYDLGQSSNSFSQGSSNYGSSEDIYNIFQDLLRNGSFGNQSYEDQNSGMGEDLHYKITIEFSEAAFGVEKEILIKKDISCEECNGTGAKDQEFETCSQCGGQGRLKVSKKSPWMIFNQMVECDNCEGTGQIPINDCPYCEGYGILNKKEKIKIKIPAGIDDGQTLRVKHEGNAIKNGSEGDLFLTVYTNPHQIFKRDGFNIHSELSINFSQAALGGEVTIPTLSGEIKIKIEKGTEAGSILRLKGRGIPHLNNPSQRGDQFVSIMLKTPKKLSKAQINLFEELAKLEEA